MKDENKTPDVIYLQWAGVPLEDVDLYPDCEPGDVTWSSERVFDSDVKYLRSTPVLENADETLEASQELAKVVYDKIELSDFVSEIFRIAHGEG